MKKVTLMIVFVFMISFTTSSQAFRTEVLKPDLTIVKITMTRSCYLAVVVKNNGPGKVPDYVYTKPDPKRAGVYVYINGKGWGGRTIPGFDPGKNLQKPGGQATYVSRYKVGPKPIEVKAVVDLWNDVKETNEKNNKMIRKGLRCKTVSKLPDLGMYGFLKVGKKKREVKWNKSILLTPADVQVLSGGKKIVDLYYSYREYNGAPASGFKNRIFFNNKLKSVAVKLKLAPKQIKSANGKLVLNQGENEGTVKINIDADNDVKESNENNNFGFKVSIKYTPFVTKPTLGPLKRFKLDFKNASSYIVYVPSNKIFQIAFAGSVVSRGADWDKKRIYSYLFDFRQKVWKGFYWRINTDRKAVYRMEGPNFGKIGDANPEKLNNIEVKVVGDTKNPTRFFLHFKDSYLMYKISTKTLQIVAMGNTVGNVLAYGGDWQKCHMKSYLYHLKWNPWDTFYWKVNTSRKQVWRIMNGQFCKFGGSETLLPIIVHVYY